MKSYDVRKWHAQVEHVHHDGGPAVDEPLVKAVVAVVLRNPFADGYVEDLSPLIEPSAELGVELAARAVALLGGRPVESYGKGGIAGVGGEQEHVSACVTTIFGDALREGVGGGEAWISSATKVGVAGETLDVPLAFKDELYVRSHYDAITLRVPNAPRPDELVIAAAVATGGRPHQRVGGRSVAEAMADHAVGSVGG